LLYLKEIVNKGASVFQKHKSQLLYFFQATLHSNKKTTCAFFDIFKLFDMFKPIAMKFGIQCATNCCLTL